MAKNFHFFAYNQTKQEFGVDNLSLECTSSPIHNDLEHLDGLQVLVGKANGISSSLLFNLSSRHQELFLLFLKQFGQLELDWFEL